MSKKRPQLSAYDIITALATLFFIVATLLTVAEHYGGEVGLQVAVALILVFVSGVNVGIWHIRRHYRILLPEKIKKKYDPENR